MIFLKSFFRKKSIKIYLAIISIILFFLLFSISIKNYYLDLVNSNYEYSYIEFEYLGNIDDIKKIKNINQVYEGFSLRVDEGTYYFLINDYIGLNDFEIAADKYIFPDQNIGSEVSFYSTNLIIKDLFENSSLYNVIYVNSNTYKYLLSLLKPNVFIYRVTLTNWLNEEKTIKNIEDNLKVSNLTTFLNKKENINFESIIFIFQTAIIIFSIVFIIVLVVTYVNIANDEKKKNYIYKCLGYSKNLIRLINFTKLSILTILSFVISFILYLLLNLII